LSAWSPALPLAWLAPWPSARCGPFRHIEANVEMPRSDATEPSAATLLAVPAQTGSGVEAIKVNNMETAPGILLGFGNLG
jgi:hypothetical protein